MPFTVNFENFPAPAGALSYAQIPWDSELFGFPVYELRCQTAPAPEIMRHLKTWQGTLPADRTCLVFARLPPHDVARGQTLAGAGFYPVETTLSFHMPFTKFTPIIRRDTYCNMKLRRMEERDLPFVMDIARHALTADRFHLDPNLPRDQAGERYARWAERAFRDGDLIYSMVELDTGRITAFIHGRRLSDTDLDMSLGAVDRNLHHAGIGVAGYQYMLSICKQLGFKTVRTVASINNIDIIKVLLRLGYALKDAQMTYHWFRGSPPAPGFDTPCNNQA